MAAVRYTRNNKTLRIGYALLALVAVFVYLYPIKLTFLPANTRFLLLVIGMVYMFFRPAKIKRSLLIVVIAFTISLIMVDLLSTVLINHTFAFAWFKKNIYVFLSVFPALMIIDLVKKSKQEYTQETILEMIVYAAIIQAIISFVLFLSPTMMDIFQRIFVPGSEALEETLEQNALLNRRFSAFSEIQYANMAAMYGYALFASIALAFSNKSQLFERHKLIYWISIVLICIAGIMSGRTFFIAMALGYIYFNYMIYKKNGVLSNICINASLLIIVLGIVPRILVILDDGDFATSVRWAFEWYYSLSETGEMSTKSTDVIINDMLIFPDNLKTWIFGDGMYSSADGYGFYMGTDVGYCRTIFYGGLIGTLIYYLVQYMFFRKVRFASDSSIIRSFCHMFFFFTMLYNLKDQWLPNSYWVLLIVAFSNSNKRATSYSFNTTSAYVA